MCVKHPGHSPGGQAIHPELPGLIIGLDVDNRYFDSSFLKITVVELNAFTSASCSLCFVQGMPSFDLSGKYREVSLECPRSDNFSNMHCRSHVCLYLILRANVYGSHDVDIAILTNNSPFYLFLHLSSLFVPITFYIFPHYLLYLFFFGSSFLSYPFLPLFNLDIDYLLGAN